MSLPDEQRLYSDEEFALILRKAAELGNRAESVGSSSTGLTLADIKSAAAQVGIDPALVERAARTMVATAKASPLERLIGGPMQHTHVVRFPVALDDDRAARLLSAVHISAGQSGTWNPGHSSALGMTFRDGGEMETLSVTARPEDNATSVHLVLDRRGTLLGVVMGSGVGILLAELFAMSALYQESSALGIGAAIGFAGGILAIARGYWVSSTGKARERVAGVMDAIGRTLSQPEE